MVIVESFCLVVVLEMMCLLWWWGWSVVLVRRFDCGRGGDWMGVILIGVL